MEDKFLLLAEELARLEKRRLEVLNELRARDLKDQERQLVLGILGEPRQGKFEDLGPLFRDSARRQFRDLAPRRNMLAEIRNLLASEPAHEFPAAEIKTRLEIGPSYEKSFYSALAKLHRLGQIRRVGRARYKSIGVRFKPVKRK
jgi:hypothetical protein